jgi:putative membrane protein insertion efficiency factor
MIRLIQKAMALLGKGLSLVLIGLVRGYQFCLSPLLPPACRFYPSCSQYFILAVRKFGPLRGSWKGVCRICRCHPWNPGGYDPP